MTTAAVSAPSAGRLWTLPGVYVPQADTRLLGRALEAEGIGDGMRVLDIGTGSGALALLAARLGARVCATDVSWRAVLTARANAARQGHRIRVRRCDLAGTPRARGTGRRLDEGFGGGFDRVVSNPPYVPTPWPGRTKGAATAWDAGYDGRRMVDRLAAHAPQLLRPGGAMLIAHSALCGVEATVRRFEWSGCEAAVVARTRVPFGPVLAARAGWLRARGLVGRDQDHEDVVVIRAQRG